MAETVAGPTFCVVCGRFDRELLVRRSGLKCSDCIGKRSNKDFAMLQQQQATFMLAAQAKRQTVHIEQPQPALETVADVPRIYAGGYSTIPTAANPAPPLSLQPCSADLGQAHPPGSPRPGQAHPPGSPRAGPSRLPPHHGAERSPSPTAPRPGTDPGTLSVSSNEAEQHAPEPSHVSRSPVMVDLEAILVTVENPCTLRGLQTPKGDTVTYYDFVVRRRYCAHATDVDVKLDGTASFSLMCNACCRPLCTRPHRFSEVLRLFEAMKAIAGDELPRLPGKKIISRFSSEFIEVRRRELEQFIQAVVLSKFLVRHPQLLDFLGIVEERRDGPEEEEEVPGLLINAPGGSPLELPPEVLARWKKGSLLGRGAFGEVYLGLLPDTSRLIAVKVLRVSSVVQSQLDKLQAELGMLRHLQHPNIVQLLGALWSRERREFSIFTEYIECGSVTRMLHKFGALPFPVIQRYLWQVLSGLEYLHGRDVVHRDIKGENILVGKDGTCKLADFGCSTHIRDIAQSGPEAADLALAGTPMFMSPEAIRGEALTPATDVWSVGCVGIELLNRSPWRMAPNENVYTAMFRFQKATGPPDGMPPEEDALPPSYRDLLLQCFRRDPGERPTAASLLAHPFFEEDFVQDDGSPTTNPRSVPSPGHDSLDGPNAAPLPA